jgi:hypothetical protein
LLQYTCGIWSTSTVSMQVVTRSLHSKKTRSNPCNNFRMLPDADYKDFIYKELTQENE